MASDIIVSNAGNSGVNVIFDDNGGWIEGGTNSSFLHYWTSGNNSSFYWVGSPTFRFYLLDGDYGGEIAYETYNPNEYNPWDSRLTWEMSEEFGSLPLPTITEEGAGITHEGEVALSSLSYLRTKKA